MVRNIILILKFTAVFNVNSFSAESSL